MSTMTMARVCSLCTIRLGSILVVPPAPSLAGNEKGGEAADAGKGQVEAGGGEAKKPRCTIKQEPTDLCAPKRGRFEYCYIEGKQVGDRKSLDCVR